MIKIELYRGFHSIWFAVSLLIGLGLVVWHTIETLIYSRPLLQLSYQEAILPPGVFDHTLGMVNPTMAQTMFFMILPILAALPFADSYYTDIKSGYVKNVFIRTRKFRYYIAKALAVFLPAAVVVLIPLLASLLATMMILPAIMPDVSIHRTIIDASRMWNGLFNTHPYVYTLLYFLIDAVFAGLFALIAPALSRFMRGRFLVLVSPFVLVYFSNMLISLLAIGVIAPMNFLKPCQPEDGLTFPIVLAIMLFLAIPCLSLFFIKGLKEDTF